jgi:hypothetical protein
MASYQFDRLGSVWEARALDLSILCCIPRICLTFWRIPFQIIKELKLIRKAKMVQENGNNSTILQQIDQKRGGNRDLDRMSDFPSYALLITITSHDMSCQIFHSPKNIKITKIQKKITGFFWGKTGISPQHEENEKKEEVELKPSSRPIE